MELTASADAGRLERTFSFKIKLEIDNLDNMKDSAEPGTPDSVNSASTMDSLTELEGNTLVCPKCSELCDDFAALKVHLATAHRKKPITCEICEIQLPNKATAGSHFRNVHVEPTENKCTGCGMHLPSQYLVKKHVRLCGHLVN